MRDSDALSDQWLLVSKLLDEALLLPVAEHAQWLANLPCSHAYLRETLRSFLELHAQVDGDGFLEAGVNLGSAALTPETDVNAGDLIGPYRLIEELGTGGMGSVWLAERADGALRRRVALKLPRLVWATNLAERMSTERDILAALEHPNIARLYDAGVDERGRPFLALEYVEGQRITDYCDRRCLDLRARVRLFLQVLDAVQYAHAQLVLHRDIKPANVLVNERGEVRLLDFGIAKIIDEPTVGSDEQGSTIGHPLTPKYASPEQLANQRLTLVSDVYSLGVMLYQILVGRLPYRTRDDSRIALEIAVMDGDIIAPAAVAYDEKLAAQRSSSVSRLKRQLTTDVSAVILKALQRNPAARYSSAEALRADLTRWLDDLPVQAKPPSMLDRISKFVTRNRWPVAVTVTAFITISIAAAIAVIQANEAKAESLRAQATRDFLISLFDNANPELNGGKPVSALELIDQAVEFAASRLGDQPELHERVLESVGNVWARLGEISKLEKVLEKRTELISAMEDDRATVRALLDQAQVAAQTDSIPALRTFLQKIEQTRGNSWLDGSSLSEINWYEGWLFLREGKAESARARFTLALRNSERVSDHEQYVRSLYGRMLAAASLGDRKTVLRDFESASKRLRDLQLSTPESLRREFELISCLAMIGEFSYGWPLIDRVFHESSQLYGIQTPSQVDLQLYWMNWAYKSGKASVVVQWLETNNRKLSDGRRDSLEWLLVEHRIRRSKGDLDGAANLIKRTSNSLHEVAVESSYKVLSLRLEGAAERGDWRAMDRILSDEWGADSDEQLVEQRVLYHWHSAVSNLLRRDPAAAETNFRIARELSGREKAASHPRNTVIDLAIILAQVQSMRNTEDFSQHKIQLQQIATELGRSYFPRHSGAVLADRLSKSAVGDEHEVGRQLIQAWDLHL